MVNESSPVAAQYVVCASALACLFRLGVRHGTYAEIGGVRRRNLLNGDTLPISDLITVAGEFGLRAESAQFDWKGLCSTPFSHPPLLALRNGHVVTLMGLRRNGPEEAAISDPSRNDGEVFFVPRQHLERVWGGTAVIATPLPPRQDEATFGFSWFTSKLFGERRLLRDIVAAALRSLASSIHPKK